MRFTCTTGATRPLHSHKALCFTPTALVCPQTQICTHPASSHTARCTRALQTGYSRVQHVMNAMTDAPLLVQATIDAIEAAAKVLILSSERAQLPAMRAKAAP